MKILMGIFNLLIVVVCAIVTARFAPQVSVRAGELVTKAGLPQWANMVRILAHISVGSAYAVLVQFPPFNKIIWFFNRMPQKKDNQ